jgi:hypothetical protein
MHSFRQNYLEACSRTCMQVNLQAHAFGQTCKKHSHKFLHVRTRAKMQTKSARGSLWARTLLMKVSASCSEDVKPCVYVYAYVTAIYTCMRMCSMCVCMVDGEATVCEYASIDAYMYVHIMHAHMYQEIYI